MCAKSRPRPIELLAPARDFETAVTAIDNGADAVYIGGPSHGARSAASNSIEDIRRIVEYAARFGVRVYVTLNTLVYDSEIDDVRRLVADLYRAGVDALIVQDMSLLEMDIPPVALHASTQCDTRTPEKALALQKSGFSQVVLARELSLDEIRDVTSAVSVPVEVFVHGALCVSFSGDCRASYLATGRSANRGECAQMCRLPYDLVDGATGRTLIVGKHFLSLKDMNRIDELASLLDAGVSSLKIEGRLKDKAYVKNVTAAYRRALDRIIDANPDRYCRASLGETEIDFEPDVESTFNRGFTSYFLTPARQGKIGSFDTPKSIGIPVGVVDKIDRRRGEIILRGDKTISNGDGLGYFDRSGAFCGFRANRVDGNRIYLRDRVPDIPVGATLYRNRDRMRDREVDRAASVRTIPVDMTIRRIDDSRVALEAGMPGSRKVAAVADIPRQEARSPQRQHRARVIEKLGDTPYRLVSLDDTLSDMEFIPASLLTSLRRSVCAILDDRIRSLKEPSLRLRSAEVSFPDKIDFRWNVANRLAEKFYRDHGVSEMQRAPEAGGASGRGTLVMECRHCIRRELDACMKTPGATKLPVDLRLEGRGISYRLKFDCSRCLMQVYQS